MVRIRNKEKQKLYSKSFYLKNKESRKLLNKIQRDKIRNFVNNFKNNNPCSDCNLFYPYYVMDFDHLGDKEFQISDAIQHSYSIKKIKEEMDKCDLVCSNCHRKRTYERMP